MKNNTVKKNRSRRYILGLLLISAAVPKLAVGANTKNKLKSKSEMQMNKDLWQVIDELIKRMPFKKSSLEELLLMPLIETRETAHTVFYEGQSVKLRDGSVLEKIDLRIGLEKNHPGFLVLDLSGACFTLDNVHSHFNPTTVTQIPTGRSVDEVTVYTCMQGWGTLSFGFRESNPNCLAYIAFAPDRN